MKTEFTDVSDTLKTVAIEIPPDVVAAEINRVAGKYSKDVRLPGFRPGKAPASVIKQRFREQIHHDVMHDLIPRAVDAALQERGIEPVDSPNIKDVVLREGQPLTFTADIQTVPPFDPGDLGGIAVTKPLTTVTDSSVDGALQRLRERAATMEAVEGRPVADGDTVVADVTRTDADGSSDSHPAVSVVLGASGNPPGFDAHFLGLSPGDERSFDIDFPADYAVAEMAGTKVAYQVKVKEIRRRVMPELDDEFAKDLGEFDSLDALKVARPRRSRSRGAGERHASGPCRAAEGPGVAARVRPAERARRPGDRPPPRRVRTPAGAAERRSATGGHRLGAVPGSPARTGDRVGGQRFGAG